MVTAPDVKALAAEPGVRRGGIDQGWCGPSRTIASRAP
jgi:hypothetical protein